MIKNAVIKTLSVFFIVAALMTCVSSEAAAGNGFTLYGDIARISLPAAALAMTVAKGDKDGAIQFGEALVSTAAVTYGLQYTVHSEGPDGEEHSFPSGHTSIAFAGASFIQQRYGWAYGGPAYFAAALVGASRIASDKHHVVDVLAGAGIGIGANLIFTKKYEKNALTITPLPLDKGAGILLGYSLD
jgi:membrane-associated phospholipid phosphatase